MVSSCSPSGLNIFGSILHANGIIFFSPVEFVSASRSRQHKIVISCNRLQAMDPLSEELLYDKADVFTALLDKSDGASEQKNYHTQKY